MTPLTPEQHAFFDAFGYLHFPGLLSDRITAITEAFEGIWAANGGGHNGRPHDGQARSAMAQFVDRSPVLHTLLDDARTHDIFTSLIGDDFNYIGSDGNYFVGDSNWHSDSYGGRGGVMFLKMAFYLDPVTRDTGCLRVIPGSHRLGEPFAELLQRDLRQCETVWKVPGPAIPAVPLETVPGDVVVFNHALKHAAFGGSSRRRMFTINACQRFPAAALPALREYIGYHSVYWVDQLYHDLLIDTATPARLVHLEQGMANDDHLPELSRQRRAEMAEPSRG